MTTRISKACGFGRREKRAYAHMPPAIQALLLLQDYPHGSQAFTWAESNPIYP
jgi:hypothetical protein